MMGKGSTVASWPAALLIIGCVAGLAAPPVPLMADLPRTTSGTVATAETTAAPAQPVAVDHKIEQQVMELVRAYLPELTTVLSQLRQVQPKQYAMAIKDLGKAARKLELARKRDPRLLEIEVELLQAEHQASMLVAKLKVRDSASDRDKLHQAAKRLQQAQISRARYDVELIRQRIAKAEQQLKMAKHRLESREQDQEVQLEKSFLNMLRQAGRDVPRNNAGSGSVSKRAGSPSSTRKAASEKRASEPLP
jgi:hypothetical protein